MNFLIRIVLVVFVFYSGVFSHAATANDAATASPAADRKAELDIHKDVSYYDGPDKDAEGFQTLDIYAPKNAKNAPVLLFVHGGGWSRKDGDPYMRGRGGPHTVGFATRGVVLVTISYRLSPAHKHPAHIEDVARAIAWVHANIATYGGDAKQLFLMGHSAGGHLVTLAVCDPKYLAAHNLTAADIRGVIPLSGVFDIHYNAGNAKVWGDEQAAADASPIRHVRAGLPPFLVLVGDTSDFEKSLSAQAEEFVGKLSADKVAAEQVTIKNRDHSTIVTKLGTADDEAAQRIMKFIASTLAAEHALSWKKGAPSPFARVEAPTLDVNGKMYVFGGFVKGLGASNELDIYDPAADSWKRLNDMPTRVTHLNPAVDRGTIWLAGGFKGKHPGPVTDEVWKYDIAADTWTSGPHLPEPRAGGGLAVAGGKLHYFGGFKSDRNTTSADHWSLPLDGSTTWRKEADLPLPRGHVAAAVVDGKIYALGGTDGHDKTQVDLKFCHCFDPATEIWSEIASLPDARSHFEGSTIVHNGRILIIAGRCNNSTPKRNLVDDMLEYNPKTDAWRMVGNIPVKLMAPSAALIGGNLIITSGGLNNPQPLTDATWIAPLPPG